MAQSGAGRSLSAGTACNGNGFTAHAIRFRVYNYSAGGFIFENSSEQRLVSITGDTGATYFNGPVTLNSSLTVITSTTNSFYSSSAFRWFNTTGFTSSTYYNMTINNYSAIFNRSILVNGDLITYSDKRIKKNIEDINDDSALQKILAIQPKTYKYIDEINKGPNKVYGFIAQQIKEVIPEAVKIRKEIIPNIYKTCDCSLNKIYDVGNVVIGTNIEIIDVSENRATYIVTDVSTLSTADPNNPLGVGTNFITIDKEIPGNDCFVYGTEVDDFHALNKDYIFTLNVCATQELNKKIDQQNQTINDLINRITQLENIINNLST
jgi:hypothetical protein